MKTLKVAILFLSVLVAVQGGEARSKNSDLNSRQPKKVVQASKMAAAHKGASRLLQGASIRAEALDQAVGQFLAASSLRPWERWLQKIDLETMQKNYSQEMRNHLASMAEILKLRRQQGKLPQYQEFEFTNLLRKSDYLLSLGISKDAVERAQKDRKFQESMSKVLVAYNQERVMLDHKMIHL